VVTKHCDLLKNNKNISTINQRASFFNFRHWYLEIRQSKNPEKHVLTESLEKLGLSTKIQKPKFFITKKEREKRDNLLREFQGKPLIAINTVCKEPTKDWIPLYWQKLIDRLADKFVIIQLGNQNELHLDKVVRFAGQLDLRESIAVLEKCNLFIGGVSFLMHAAAAVGVKSVIIYGGRETPNNSGYKQNKNLYEKMSCGPCWIHQEDGEFCIKKNECMKNITPNLVYTNVLKLLSNKKC